MKAASSMESTHTSVEEIAFQAASLDIWDKKYRLVRKDNHAIDLTIDDTYARVAKALAEVEQTEEKQEEWNEKFL